MSHLFSLPSQPRFFGNKDEPHTFIRPMYHIQVEKASTQMYILWHFYMFIFGTVICKTGII